jgi:hypothetical protein
VADERKEAATRLTPTEPYPIVVTRWVCGGWGCSRSYSKRSSIEGHMETCWKVPENRTCLTCENFVELVCCGFLSDQCGCRGERDWECMVDITIEAGKPTVLCPSWAAPNGSGEVSRG